jgi:hypothetical protein
MKLPASRDFIVNVYTFPRGARLCRLRVGTRSAVWWFGVN